MSVPVLFIIFNRPDTTRKVFDQIRNAKPSSLFIAGDGPRNESETVIVKETREIVSEIDWNCEVEVLFREKNLGCKNAVSSAIDWFFGKNEMGIILEDDCVPQASFFKYCEKLLIKYKDEEKIMQISGFNPVNKLNVHDSYYFSKFGPIWGWASWSRAWKHNDLNMTTWVNIKRDKLYKKFCDSYLEERWRINVFDKVYSNKINTWDYQWVFSKLIRNGLSIVPKENLITNIGFAENATHTNSKNKDLSFYKVKEMQFPLIHPHKIERNKIYDKKYFYEYVMNNVLKDLRYKYFRFISK